MGGLFDDLATWAEGMNRPQPQHTSVGLVDADTPSARSVQFADDDGTPLPYPLVNVTLVPSGTRIPCRVGQMFAGKGEGCWSPFVAGDEVMVIVPGGNEWNGGVIVARLTNNRDTFPGSVGGTDPTKNTSAFLRMVAPLIIESGNSILLREAATGAYVSISQTGAIVIANGEGDYLAVRADLIGFQTADLSCAVQIDPSAKNVLIQGQAAQLLVDQAAASFLTPGTFAIGTAGNQPAWHATSIESVLVLLQNLLVQIGVTLPGPLTGAGLAAQALVVLPAAIAASAALPISPTLTGPVVTALAAGSTLANPNVAATGLLIG